MNDNPLYDLLAKAELHPNSLTPIERLIWWIHETNNDNGCNNDILIASATELEQLQQNSEAERDTVWLGEPVPAPMFEDVLHTNLVICPICETTHSPDEVEKLGSGIGNDKVKWSEWRCLLTGETWTHLEPDPAPEVT